MNAAHEFLSFEKLLEKVPDTRGTRMPTAKQLRESDAIILDKIESDTYCLTVYTNGYFMYRSGRRSTVRSVHNCQTPMVYHDATGNRESIGIDVFGELPYPIRLMFEGETLLE